MGVFAITVTITCVLFLIIGVHTETRRVLYAMLAAVVIFISSSLTMPAIGSVLISFGPALDAQGQVMKDARGELVYSMTSVRNYSRASDEFGSVLYLSGAIFAAGCILLLSRAFRP